ncbi:unnamed protein product [Miscanthus lutarioriparius]|uniref:Ribosomal RNA-processing protein 8 n=1 Tax=Miscanthus lutarioriparius TaxID=422564 RepID=A0A811Q697_9POAL|nr:unnamed protein product [Miscanthus lutarioriparius]
MPKRGNTSSLLDKVVYLTRMTGLEGVFSGAVEGLGCKLYRIPRLLIGDNKNLLHDGQFCDIELMRARLSGGHFRMLNEKLYTCSGEDAFDYFKNDPNLFDVYHTGYQEQMSHWPEQPVNVIINWLKSHNASWTVADFGCVAKNVKNKVFSIDLVSDDPSVIACDMAHTPLEPSSIDVAIFCLSLMGINYPSYLEEANRVLKPSGWLVIAEVRSRLDPNNGGADPEKFSKAIIQLGFSLVSKDVKNKMFILFYFRKKEKSKVAKSIDWPQLKPCLYKRR